MRLSRRSAHPEPENTPAGPAYDGRLLPRPDDEVVDQGLAFDLGTYVGRRRMLAMVGIGAGTLAVAACSTDTSSSAGASTASGSTGSPSSGSTSSGSTSSGSSSDGTTSDGLTEIPDETAGPYPGDGSNGPDVLEESGIVRRDIRSSLGDSGVTAEGVPLTVQLTVLDLADGGSPFAGVAVYAWHCDRDGNYSMYADGLEDVTYLRGVQIADSDGKVTFTSIFPACYSGRWPHIHFEVYPDQDSFTDTSSLLATSQLALPANACTAVYATDGYEQSVQNLAQVSLTSDNVFGDDGGVHQIAAMTGSVSAGYVASLTVPIDTTTKPTGGSMGGGGGTPPGGGSGGPGA